MKATDIVHRVDDLGRIVILREIRRTLRIRKDDSLLKNIDSVGWLHMGYGTAAEETEKQVLKR